MTSLGLVQMTRKRVGGGLLEHFSTPCEHCRGRGVIVTTEPAAESNGRDRGERDRAAEPGGRRSRGRGRRDEANGDRGRRLPAVIVPDLPGPAEPTSPPRRFRTRPRPSRRIVGRRAWTSARRRRPSRHPRCRRWRRRPWRTCVTTSRRSSSSRRWRPSATGTRHRTAGWVTGPGLCAGSRGGRRDERGRGRRARSRRAGTGGQAAARPRDAHRRRAGGDSGRRSRRPRPRHGARRCVPPTRSGPSRRNRRPPRRRPPLRRPPLRRPQRRRAPRSRPPSRRSLSRRSLSRRSLSRRSLSRRPPGRRLRQPVTAAADRGGSGVRRCARRPACARGVRYGGRRRGGAAVSAAALPVVVPAVIPAVIPAVAGSAGDPV